MSAEGMRLLMDREYRAQYVVKRLFARYWSKRRQCWRPVPTDVRDTNQRESGAGKHE